ncbi:MAG: hypothetical protein JW889_03600 [Verrucomicrobia bacterium]|nr:hypothetical protein [Verrucomicrobiota bacterium]
MTPQEWQALLCWTFSTIAQTLAGGFGILAVLVVFRLQSAENQIVDHARILPYFLRPAETQEWLNRLRDGELSAFLDWFGKESPRKNISRQDNETVVSSATIISYLGSVTKKSLMRLKVSLCLTAASIGGCLILLSLSNVLAASSVVSVVALSVTTLLAIICLLAYVQITLATLAARGTVIVEKPRPADRSKGNEP